MQSGLLKYYDTGKELDDRRASGAYVPDDYRYSDQSGYDSQECDHFLEDLYTIDEIANEEEEEGEEAEKVEALVVQHESPNQQRLLDQKTPDKVDWIDHSLQQLLHMRSTLKSQHIFNTTKRAELNEISASLERARSLLQIFSHTLSSGTQVVQMKSETLSNRPTSTLQDRRRTNNSQGMISTLPRLVIHSSKQLNRNPSFKTDLKSPSTVNNSNRSSSVSENVYTLSSKYSFPKLPSFASRSTLTLSTSQSDINELKTSPIESTLRISKPTLAIEILSHPDVYPHDVSRWSSTSEGTHENYNSNQIQTSQSVELLLPSIQNKTNHDYPFELGWDKLEDLFSQFKISGHIPSDVLMNPSKMRWLRFKLTKTKHNPSKKHHSDRINRLMLRLARLC
ncbi:hypothetical protein CROQUDRAFT_105484 [Cronartium quercuum f. sp. fusiforme G11]|uniref:Uncharacterized protein n=1 Tax=Cronartium quercuum f. sp. fusiforme G11 TaxID=708437 RepID=A0A9P6NKZ4_9BASI|nr:hypothetical protein CROQUDRAFT_105484 [Cronartium quercuum f. sp. fusiforme G11]